MKGSRIVWTMFKTTGDNLLLRHHKYSAKVSKRNISIITYCLLLGTQAAILEVYENSPLLFQWVNIRPHPVNFQWTVYARHLEDSTKPPPTTQIQISSISHSLNIGFLVNLFHILSLAGCCSKEWCHLENKVTLPSSNAQFPTQTLKLIPRALDC